MSNLNSSEVKDPDGISEEQRQELADTQREALAETPPADTAKADFDVVNNAHLSSDAPDEILGDIEALSVNEKYALVLHQAKQLGPLFFAQVSPETFKLPERDPLNLIWINILTGWQIASTILSQFEQNIMTTEELEREGTSDDSGEDIPEDAT